MGGREAEAVPRLRQRQQGRAGIARHDEPAKQGRQAAERQKSDRPIGTGDQRPTSAKHAVSR